MGKYTLGDYMMQEPGGSVHLHITRVKFGGYDREQSQQMMEELVQYYHHRVSYLLDTLAQQKAEIERLKSACSD